MCWRLGEWEWRWLGLGVEDAYWWRGELEARCRSLEEGVVDMGRWWRAWWRSRKAGMAGVGPLGVMVAPRGARGA